MEDVKLTLQKCDVPGFDDWYLIERAEHDGREWIEDTGPSSDAYQCSERVSDADVEGTAQEMRDIAEGIRKREPVSFKRCSVRFTKRGGVDVALFSSPRNSQADGVVPLARADELATEITTKLGTRGGDAIL